MDVVSQFLDLIRRGGADSGANQLLTQKAQSELARIGRSIQPLGSPDAGFRVTRSGKRPRSARLGPWCTVSGRNPTRTVGRINSKSCGQLFANPLDGGFPAWQWNWIPARTP